MNVTEFAEQIIFGKTLEDKLLVPGKLTHDAGFRDRQNRPNVERLISPARPTGLEMRHDKGGNVQPPSDNSLENERARGQLLHFLANHELLATELMALVLLKFPDAPRGFRQGVLVTLQEEQAHTRMYLRRMKECGVEFGQYPLSGQFWRVIEPMKSPMDFVSQLSLTFEQANLDYSLHFANVFQRIGDQDTADVLQKIYEDEIGHVSHGLQWFRQWKDPQQSDWEAYQAALEFPMSPQRARGPRGAFNRTGRLEAGLSESFIDSIEVFRQSRGRAPVVRWFDPAAEAELAGELTDGCRKPATLLDQLAKDLELAMVPVARQDDVMLVRREPSRTFRMNMIKLGIELPEFVLIDQRQKLADRKLHQFSPWAWTPKNLAIADPLVDSTRHSPPPWSPNVAAVYRKSWATARLLEWQCQEAQHTGPVTPDWFTDPAWGGTAVHDLSDLPDQLKRIAGLGFQNAIFKQDLGASGRGQRRLNCLQPLTTQDQGWLHALPTNDGMPIGVIEPELNRVVDLSFLWRLAPDHETANFLGWTRPLISAGRRYAGTRLGTALSGCAPSLRRFLLADRCRRIMATVQWLQPRITAELLSRNFVGHFGIDALVCHTADGELKLKPVVEVNPRMTMGHVALNLKKRVEPGAEAEFRIFRKAEWDQIADKIGGTPMETIPDGRWKSGVFCLGEPNENTQLVPVMLVGQTPE